MSESELLNYLGTDGFALFVSSGHPPNVEGFIKGIGLDSGFIPPNFKIVVAGSSSSYILDRIRETQYWDTSLNRMSFLEETTEVMLDNLYAYAKAIIVPIFLGSGSSIKAREALLSMKPVITTAFGLRGEDIKNDYRGRIVICESQVEFKKALVEALTSESLPSPLEEFPESLEWKNVKNKATEYFRRILNDLNQVKK
jgi:glycosyltransferase involved in cell wall biosynthesis